MQKVEELSYCEFIKNECPECLIEPVPNSSFFGYPSKPQPVVDAIQNAIKALRKSGKLNVVITDWKDLEPEGSIIFCEICKAIRKAKLALLNVTNTNFNVLFEFGFAIGLGRKIYPLLEKGVERTEGNYLDIHAITTIGYFEFTDSKSIVTKLTLKKPWEKSSNFPSLPSPLGLKTTAEAVDVLYLKSPHNDEPSSWITDTLTRTSVGIITDDPSELKYQPLFWYIQKIGQSYAVIINLGSERAVNIQTHRAKCALVAGASLALGRRLLITGEDINLEPIDYRDLVRNYQSTKDARKIVREFIDSVESVIEPFQKKRIYSIVKPEPATKSPLNEIDLGDYNADNEKHLLNKYFVETDEFLNATKPIFRIYVGRKGSGKSANFYMVANKLIEDKRNIVCQIQPKDYELSELVQLVKDLKDIVKQGYVLESLWKYLLYSEAIKAIYDRIITRPSKAGQTEIEDMIVKYIQERDTIFKYSFTARLIKEVNDLFNSLPKKQEVHISELLHSEEITDIEKLLCDYMSANTKRFAILIDKLDANWQMGEDYEIMSDILLALFDSARDMWRRCQSHMKGLKVDEGLSILIFIRSDVFSVALRRAREADKLEYDLISWTNVRSLLDLINKRIQHSTSKVKHWEEILEPSFTPSEMEEWLKRNMLLRPRDIIFLFRNVLFNARRRKALTLSKDDFGEAMAAYSDYVLQSVLAESQPYIADMEGLLLEFMGEKAIVYEEDIARIFAAAGIDKSNSQQTLDYLLESNFLGYLKDRHNYAFPTTPNEHHIAKRHAWSYAKKESLPHSYRIHPSFYKSLEIRS